MRLHREVIKKGFTRKAAQTAAVRHRVQSHNRTDRACFTSDRPFLYPFLSLPPRFLPDPLPLHIPSSIYVVTLSPTSDIWGPKVSVFISHKAQVCLHFCDSPSTCVTTDVCFFSFCPLCLSARLVTLDVLFIALPFSFSCHLLE